MKTKQKNWANGKYLPPKKKWYRNIEDYITDIQKYIPTRVTDAYKEDYEKRGY